MDDEVGTAPEEHLMRDFGHMKTSLQSVCEVVLRKQGDTVIFWGREITKTGRGCEERNST